MRKITGLDVFLVIASLNIMTSCKKFIEIPSAPGLVETSEVFTNEQTALSAVSGVYVHMRGSNLLVTNGGMSLYGGLAADELFNTASNSIADPFYRNSLLANNSTVSSNFWGTSYANIYKVNAILEGLAGSAAISETTKKQLRGEMLVVRSFYYFYLVNLFGDVPLILTTDYRVNAIMPRTKTDEVYRQIIQDLEEAKGLLASDYVSANRARPNRWTAEALLARIYLYQQDWIKAENAASAVIGSGMYSLVANIQNVFAGGSAETIWQVTSDLGNTAEGANFLPSSATVRPTYAIHAHLLNDFETGDLRKSQWIKSNTVSSIVYPYPYKYKVRSGTPISEYNILLRLAEQYLIRAEARAMQDKVSESTADLNIVRSRSLPGNLVLNNRAELLQAVAQERRAEFFCEWGHRWMDLKRTHTSDLILGNRKSPWWESTDALFPIPQAQLQINVFLQQNPGY